MFMKGLAAALALLIFNAGAQAKTYSYDLQYSHTIYAFADINDRETDEDLYDGDLHSSDDIWGLPTLLPGLNSRTVYRLTLDITDDGVSCDFGGFDCGISRKDPSTAFVMDPLSISNEVISITFQDMKPGAQVAFWDVENYPGHRFESEDYIAEVHDRNTYFTLLAPVPLPATAMLLPAGIGALTLFRRRRRKIS